MAINDDDKKFIKDTIENAIEKRMDTFEKTNDMKQKSQQLKWEETRKKDRDAYLAELQQRDKKGEATIAQKMEMLKLSVDKAIPEDLKNAAKSGGRTIANGANQLGAGLGHLNERLMMSNPLTAMLYQNRDILGAIGNVGIGAAKIGWGATKGLAQGVAGLFNTAVNAFKPKDNEEETEQESTGFFNANPPKERKGIVEDLLESKQDWQKQIDDIHKNVTKQGKEEKKSNEFLAKGLAGLGDTMKAVKGVIDVIQSKQKIIVTGLLMGVAAIAGLAAWFQSGGLSNLLKSMTQNPGGDESKLQATFGTNAQFSGLTGEEFKNTFTEKANNNQLTGVAETKANTVQKKNLLGIKYTETNGYTYKTGKMTPVLAPFDGIVQHVRLQTSGDKNNQQFKYQIVLAKVIKGTNAASMSPMQAAMYPGGAMGQAYSGQSHAGAEVTFNHIIDPQVYMGQEVPKDYVLGFSDGSFTVDTKNNNEMNKIMKDYGTQINKAKESKFENAIDVTAKNKDAKKTKQTILKGAQKKLKEENKDYKDLGWDEKAIYNILDYDDTHRNLDETWKSFTNPQTKQETPSVTNTPVTPESTNGDKAKQQTNDLQKKPEQTQTTQTPQTQTTQTAPSGNVTIKQNNTTTPQFADKNLSQAQYGLMTANSTNLGIPN